MYREVPDAVRSHDEASSPPAVDEKRTGGGELVRIVVDDDRHRSLDNHEQHVALVVAMLGDVLARGPDEQRCV